MPLSEYEQRVLAQMERQLSSDDPKLAQTFAGAPRGRRTGRVALGVAVVVVGLGALVGGVALHLSWLGVVGFAVMFLGVMVALSRGKEAPGAPAAPSAAGAGTKGARPKSSFMTRMEERWERRRHRGQ